MIYIITAPCTGMKNAACVEVCPVDCIYEGEEQYFINPDECIGCGKCEPECPVSAIFTEQNIPAGSAESIAQARAFFGS